MAEASSANLGRGCEEKRHEESSPESVPPGTTISRVKLLDTMVDTFLQKLVAAGSAGPRLPSGGQPVKQAFSWAACRLPRGRKAMGSEFEPSSTRAFRLPHSLCPLWPSRRPSGIPEKDLHSAMAPYFLQQRDTLRRHVQKQEAENRQLADAVLAGRRELEELQLQVQARQQAWQALHREQKELVAVLREPE
uniref:Polyamine modulated factor 1 n=1 Tax=Aotus nancymaae TaxID=37293 RepID=A0A2K5DMY7_AOTNA